MEWNGRPALRLCAKLLRHKDQIAEMILKGRIWKPVIAGLCGTTVHFLFMYFKLRFGLLPSFQPYQSFQLALSQWVGANVPAIVPWALSFVNGMTILGFLFGRLKRLLLGRNGAIKGLSFVLIGLPLGFVHLLGQQLAVVLDIEMGHRRPCDDITDADSQRDPDLVARVR
jgi:hypothetical protein